MIRKIAYWFSLILIFSIPWEDSVIVSGVGTANKAIGLITAAAWIASVAYSGRVRKLTPFHVAAVLFIAWNITSILWTADFKSTLARTQTYALLLVFILILWDLYTTPAALSAGLQSYILGAYISVGSALYNFIEGIEFSPGRYSAAGANPDHIGLVVAMGIPIAWYLVTHTITTGRQKLSLAMFLFVLNIVYLPAAVFAITLTATRTALIAAVPGILYILISLRNIRLFARVLIFLVLAVLFVVIQPYIPAASVERLASTGSELAEGDLSGRTKIWGDGLFAFSEHPIIGVGASAFRTVNSRGKVAHNVFLSVLVEVGLVGFGIFAFILLLTVDQIMRLPRDDFLFWIIIFGIWLIGAAVLTWEHKKQTWLFLSLVIATGKLAIPSAHQFVATAWNKRPPLQPIPRTKV